MPSHDILGGKVQVFKRGDTWHARGRVNGAQFRTSTKTDELSLAKELAEDWYLGLRGKARAGLPLTERPGKSGPTFNEIADIFEEEYELITGGERSKKWVQSHKDRLRLHLRPFFGKMAITEVDQSSAQRYRLHRANGFGRLPPKDAEGNFIRPPKPPSRSTIHDEIGTLSLVLQTAMRHKKIQGMPDLSPPYRQQKKVLHRPWFTLDEYKQLYAATGKAAKAALERHKWAYEQLHDQILFLGNTGMRPDEAVRLQHRDVTIAHDSDTGEEILEIEVRGKTGYGPCKSMPGAVFGGVSNLPAPELPKPTDLLFPSNHTDLFNEILVKHDLKYDREGHPRVLYSLRHTYICLRLLDGADIYQLAKNCRTSVEMIEKHYAIHLKNIIDASAINIRKAKSRKRTKKTELIESSDEE